MQVEALFKAHKDRLREESYRDEAVQSIRANIRWLASNGAAVCAWLKTPAPAAMRVPGLPGAALAPAPAAAMAPTGMRQLSWKDLCWSSAICVVSAVDCKSSTCMEMVLCSSLVQRMAMMARL